MNLRTPVLPLLALLLLACIPARAQLHRKGQVHGSIGLALGLHKTWHTQTVQIPNWGIALTNTHRDSAATITFPATVSYGITDGFSLGLFLELGSYLDSNMTRKNGIALLGIEPRVYAVNTDRFAWLFNLQLGGCRMRITEVAGTNTNEARYRGGIFGLGTGFIFGLSDVVDLELHGRYLATNLSLRSYLINGTGISSQDYKGELETKGLILQAALGFRF